MSEYTPTTAEVKDAYVRTIRQAFITSTGEHATEFERWLETIQHDAWEAGRASVGIDLSKPLGGQTLNAHGINPHTRHPLGPQEDPTDECD